MSEERSNPENGAASLSDVAPTDSGNSLVELPRSEFPSPHPLPGPPPAYQGREKEEHLVTQAQPSQGAQLDDARRGPAEGEREDVARGDVTPASSNPKDFVEQKLLEGKVIEAISEIFDPEIPVNIYELGLIYEIKVEPDNSVLIKMTLTAPACPVAGSLPGDVEKRVNAIPEVKEAKVELVWDPPWTREMMSEAALLTLGF